MAYTRTSQTLYNFGVLLIMGIATSLIGLLYEVAALFYVDLSSYQLLDIILTIYNSLSYLFLLVSFTTLMVILIIKSQKFIKVWIYSFGIYLCFTLTNFLFVPFTAITVYEVFRVILPKLFILTVWTITIIYSKSFKFDPYGAKIRKKLDNKMKRFMRNIWS